MGGGCVPGGTCSEGVGRRGGIEGNGGGLCSGTRRLPSWRHGVAQDVFRHLQGESGGVSLFGCIRNIGVQSYVGLAACAAGRVSDRLCLSFTQALKTACKGSFSSCTNCMATHIPHSGRLPGSPRQGHGQDGRSQKEEAGGSCAGSSGGSTRQQGGWRRWCSGCGRARQAGSGWDAGGGGRGVGISLFKGATVGEFWGVEVWCVLLWWVFYRVGVGGGWQVTGIRQG